MSRNRHTTLTEPAAGPPPAKGKEPVFLRQSAGRTDPGIQREQNEDALLIDDAAGIYVVCDGMGGHASGQVASDMAIRTIVDSLDNLSIADGAELLKVALERANEAILDHASTHAECKGMGTTAVAIRIDADRAHICHCGDSRCYLLRNGGLMQLTEDHSLQNLYRQKPELAEKLGPAHSNVIVRAVGLEAAVDIEHQIVDIENGDLFLLCCDGLTDLVEDWMIREIMTSGEPLVGMAENLVRAANANGGIDNITVILVRVQRAAQVEDAFDRPNLEPTQLEPTHVEVSRDEATQVEARRGRLDEGPSDSDDFFDDGDDKTMPGF